VAARYRVVCETAWWDGAGVEPLTPTVETSPAAHIAAIVIARSRLGVSQPSWCVCSQTRRPLADDAAAIAQPTHMSKKVADPPRS
jgi:hypothetical protein